jgi:hypothetical protein
MARVMLMTSEWKLANKSAEPNILVSLQEARQIFSNYDNRSWELRTINAVAEYYFNQKAWIQAKKWYKKASRFSKEIKDRHMETLVKEKLNFINSRMRRKQKNGLTFLKAVPLV